MKAIVSTLARAIILATIAVATSSLNAQDDEEWMPAPIPDALRMAILSDAVDGDQVTWTRHGDSGYVPSYLKSPNHCESGGCRSRVWRDGDGAVEVGRRPVSRLPIVAPDEGKNGAPTHGVTVSDGFIRAPAFIPVSFDGQRYSDGDWERLFPIGSGSVLVEDDQLSPVSRLKELQSDSARRGFGALPRDYGNYCTGLRGNDQVFYWDIGDKQATIRFDGEIRYLKVPASFTSPDARSSGSPFHSTWWLSEDLAVQFTDIAPPTGGMTGPESDGFELYTVSMTGVSGQHFDRIEMQVRCGL